jgi:hypothetical protein
MTTPTTYDVSYDTSPLIPLAKYAEARGITTRTVMRWLDKGELPGATRDESNRWLIPAGAERTTAAIMSDIGSAVAGLPTDEPAASALVVVEQRPRISDLVEHLTGYVPLSIAAEALGIKESTIRRHRDRYELEPVGGANGQELMMTRAKLKEILG